MEIPNNAKPEEMMDFKKFAQSIKKVSRKLSQPQHQLL